MIQIILKYFPDLSLNQKSNFEKLFELYTFWNNQINVISRKDIDLIYERHVLHSLGIAKVISFRPGTQCSQDGNVSAFVGDVHDQS